MTHRRNILVVHGLPSLKSGLRSSLDYILAFERYAPENNYFYHRMSLPVPQCVRETRWDAAIFDSTALCFAGYRPRALRLRIRNEWAFLRQAPAVKIAFPQDDASHGAILDLFFSWLGIDAVYTVLPEHTELLYPISSRRARFFPTFAGFIDDRSIADLENFARPFEARRWEIGQRVTFHPAWGGSFSRLKGRAAVAVREEARRRGVAENISVDDNDIFRGDDWYRFLGDCRFVVGAEGGMSLWDPYGAVYDEVTEFTSRHPDAAFEEIADACFPGLDGRFGFPVITPRVFEAALMGCGQILAEGGYGGVIEPGRHYIPLKPDFSNLAEVFEATLDRDRVRAMIAATRRDLVEAPRYRYSTLVAEIIEFLEARAPAPAAAPSADEFARSLRPYGQQLVQSTAALGAGEADLAGDALRAWTRTTLEGHFDEPDRLEALLDFALPATKPSPAGAESAAPAGAGEPETAEPRSAAPRALARLAAAVRRGPIRRLATWAVAGGIAAATYPAAVAALRHAGLAPPSAGGWFSTSLTLSLLLGWALLPHRFRSFRVAGLRRSLIAAALWVVAGHAIWLLPQYFSGMAQPGERRLLVATIAAQAALALAARLGLWLAGDRRARYWCLAMAAGVPLFLVAFPGIPTPAKLAFLEFVALAFAAFAGLVIRRGLAMQYPLRYTLGLAAATVGGLATWILALFAQGLLDPIPRWLPPALGACEIALAALLPIALDLARGRLALGSLAYDPARLLDPRTRVEIRPGSPGSRMLWLLIGAGAAEDARLFRMVEALREAGWAILACGPVETGFLSPEIGCLRLPQSHGFRREFLGALRLLRGAALAMLRLRRPDRLRRWAAILYQWCRPEELHLYRSLLWVCKTRPELAPELVIAQGRFVGEVATAFARRLHAPLAVDFRESAAAGMPRDAQWAFGGYDYVPIVEERCLARAGLVTVPSGPLAERLAAEQKLMPPPLVVRAVSLGQPRPQPRSSDRLRVLYQGSLWHPQQLHLLIRSMPLWRPEFDLVLRGDGDPAYIAELRRLAARLGLEARIAIEPAPIPAAAIEAASAADIGYLGYAAPLRAGDGAAPAKFFDYLAAGLAVCVGELGEMPALVRRYGIGRLVSEHSPSGIAQAINGFTREIAEECRRASCAAAAELDWQREKAGIVGAFEALSHTSLGARSRPLAETATGFAPAPQPVAQK